MLIACWSAKGGSGTTVVACALALVLAERSSPQHARVLLADLAGDVPAVLARAEPDGPGLNDWMAADPEVGSESLARLEVDVDADARRGLRLLAQGRTPAPTDADGARLPAALTVLAADGDNVVVDCGVLDSTPSARHKVAAAADLSLLVIRPCFLALRRALAVPLRPTGAVVVWEPKGALHARDVEAVLRIPVMAQVPVVPLIGRAVDAGLLTYGVPACLGEPLRRAIR